VVLVVEAVVMVVVVVAVTETLVQGRTASLFLN
jgi:hypothetical protein